MPFVVISSESNEGNMRNSGQMRYDAWAWIRLTQADDYSVERPLINAELKKQRFGPPMHNVPLYYKGGRLVPDYVWQEDDR